MDDDIDKQLEKIKNLGLENYLLLRGVPSSNIEKAKNETSDSDRKFYLTYDPCDVTLDMPKIDVDLIKGVHRVHDVSWFDIVQSALEGDPKDHDLNISSLRFMKLLNLFTEGDFEYVKEKFENELFLDCTFISFEDALEKKYFISDDGNHRTILAKLLGIERIRVRTVKIYNRNDQKYLLMEMYNREKINLITWIKVHNYDIDDDFSPKIICYNQQFIFNFPFSSEFNFLNTKDELKKSKQILVKLEEIERLRLRYRFYFKFIPKKLLEIYVNSLMGPTRDDSKKVAKRIEIKNILARINR